MRVAFIGLGNMGRPMAEHVAAAGHTLTVHDARRPAGDPLVRAGSRWADSPAEAAREAEVIFTSLPGPAEVEAVLLGERGVLAGAARGAIYADLSTSSVGLIRRIHAAASQRGVTVLDAPVSGGTIGAQNATLQIMVGGDVGAFERIRPVLSTIGSQITHFGEVGTGTVAKLVHNLVAACAFQSLAEGMTLGVKAGLDPGKLLEAIVGGAYGQGISLRRSMPEVVFKGDFDRARFALALMRKDVGLAVELAREHQVPMPILALAEQDLVQAVGRGWGAQDSSAVFKLQEERAGVTVRQPARSPARAE